MKLWAYVSQQMQEAARVPTFQVMKKAWEDPCPQRPGQTQLPLPVEAGRQHGGAWRETWAPDLLCPQAGTHPSAGPPYRALREDRTHVQALGRGCFPAVRPALNVSLSGRPILADRQEAQLLLLFPTRRQGVRGQAVPSRLKWATFMPVGP